MGNPIGQLPLADPQTVARMMQLTGGNGAIPPTSPVQPTALDPQQVGAQAMQRGTQLTEEQLSRGRSMGDQAQELIRQQEATPIPKMGFQPDFSGGFFHNLGQALLALGASTLPGRAVQGTIYGPRIKRYEEETGARAKQIAELQQGQKQEYEPVGATGRMGPAYLGAEARLTTAKAATDRAAAYVQSIADRAKNFVAMQDWRTASLDERKRSNLVNEAQRQADEAGRDYREQHRDATTEEVAQIVTGTRQQIANEAAARDPGVKSWLFNALGIDVPQIQGAPSPEFRETPKAGTAAPATPVKPTAKPKASGGKKGVYNPATGQVEWK